MRSLVLLLMIGFWTSISAQGSLQFNQVKVVTTTETVPVGKVWKVESVIYNIPLDQSSAQSSATASCSVTRFRHVAIEVNGIPTKVGEGSHTASYSNLDFMHSYTKIPFWLPAGFTLSGGPCLNMVSVLEFNIIP